MNARRLKVFAGHTAISLCVALVIGLPSQAQNKDTLWTQITAQGNNVTVTWDKNHPWDQQLSTQGADLVAEYQIKNAQFVREVLGHATSHNDRTYRYSLPDTIKAQPLGDICLYVQPSWSRGLLPIRNATSRGSDTARFRYEPWERVVEAHADAAAAQQAVAATENEIRASDQAIAAQEATLNERGWTSAPACQAITVAPSQDEPQPYDVVEPGRHDDIANRVCVHRVYAGRTLMSDSLAILKQRVEARKMTPQEAVGALRGLFQVAFQLPELAKLIRDELKPPAGDATGVFDTRQAQAREFLRRWDAMSGDAPNYEPHLGKADDVLALVSSSTDIAFQLQGAELAKAIGIDITNMEKPTYTELLGLIGNALDAYFGCVEDGRKQLQTKYESWQALQNNAPERDRQKREFFVRECTDGVSKLDQLKGKRSELQTRLAEDKQKLLPTSSPPLPSRPQVLNAISCNRP